MNANLSYLYEYLDKILLINTEAKKLSKYITTPIYYVNGEAHIGHAYTTFIADTMARYEKLKGEDTYFVTGTDEHGQKIEESAQKNGKPVQEFADEISATFKTLWDEFEISYDRSRCSKSFSCHVCQR